MLIFSKGKKIKCVNKKGEINYKDLVHVIMRLASLKSKGLASRLSPKTGHVPVQVQRWYAGEFSLAWDRLIFLFYPGLQMIALEPFT